MRKEKSFYNSSGWNRLGIYVPLGVRYIIYQIAIKEVKTLKNRGEGEEVSLFFSTLSNLRYRSPLNSQENLPCIL